MSTEPKYLHPSVTSKIIDTSSVVLTAAGLNNMFVALEAEKGAPNEAMYISSASQFIFTLGEPNFAKWGQAGMNAMNWLRAGGGLWVIRVVPDDETFASLSLGIGFNDAEKYTNDEEEYKNLELTADQIKLWNLDIAADDDNRKLVRGLATGSTIPVEKFYAGKKDKTTGEILSVESKLGTMTSDAIKLYNRGNGLQDDAESALEPLAVTKEDTVDFGMSYGDYLKAAGTRAHLRGEEKYDICSVGGYALIQISNYSATNQVNTGAIRHLPGEGQHSPSYDSLFAAESLESFLLAVKNDPSVIRWSVSTDASTGVFTVKEIIQTDNTFDNVFESTTTISKVKVNEEVYVNAPKLVSATYAVTEGRLYKAIAEDINEAFVATEIGDVIAEDSTGNQTGLESSNHEAISAGTAAIGQADINKLETMDSSLYGPCYVRTYEDATSAIKALELQNKNLKLSIIKQEAIWQYCYEVFYEDGTPYKTTAMTVNGIRWFNYNHKGYEKLREITELDVPSTGIYERVKTYNVNYAISGEPVYGFYMTKDDIESYNRTKPKNRAEVTATGELSGDIVLESMVKTTETIFNQTASISFSAKSNDANFNKAIRALSYLAPLFKFESAEAEKSGYRLLTATLNANDTFTAVQIRNLAAKYRTNADESKNLIDPETNGFKASFDDADLQAIGLYSTEEGHALNTNASFVITGIEVPEVIATLMENASSQDVQIPTGEDNYAVSVWNIAPVINAIPSGDAFNLTIKLSFYATANGAALIALDDETERVVFKASSINEYLKLQNYQVQYEESGFVPNSKYVENTYKAIGFCATVFTDRSKDNIDHTEKTPADFKRGYVVDENRVAIQSVDAADMRLGSTRFVEFARFLPKGSGPWYNKLAVSLTYENAYNNTYPDWSMFTLSVIEKSTTSEIIRETFDVSLDPDAISGTKESLFIEDVVNRYSSYLTCVVNYENLQNFIDTKLKITNASGETVKDEDGNEIVPNTDKVIKYIFNQITLDELNQATFGDDYKETEYADVAYTDLMSAIGYDEELCHLDTTLTDNAGSVMFNDPFVSEFYYQTVDTNAVFYLAGGSRGNGWGYETVDPETDEIITHSTLTQALTRAYNGTTDPLVTNTQTCVFDIMMDANYDITVKDAMSDLASMTRGDCVTILDMNHDCANASQAVAKRKDQMQYNTYFTSIFSQTLGINDEWTGKPVRVTPTFFLATKIPQNDAAYTEIYNFVGPRRGTIAGFRDVSWLPTEPEKTELYKNQINYIEQDTQATMFATENTSQKITSPLSMIHAVRSLLKLKRQMEQTARNYRMEFSTDDIRGHLQEALNNIANNKVLAGGYDYISPVVSASAYDRQQKICRVKVDLAFTDIMERFVFEFVVNRAS